MHDQWQDFVIQPTEVKAAGIAEILILGASCPQARLSFSLARTASRSLAQVFIKEVKNFGVRTFGRTVLYQASQAPLLYGYREAIETVAKQAGVKPLIANGAVQSLPAAQAAELQKAKDIVARAMGQGAQQAAHEAPLIARRVIPAASEAGQLAQRVNQQAQAGVEAAASVEQKITTETARKIWDASKELEKLKEITSKLSKKVPDPKLGTWIDRAGESMKKYSQLEQQAKELYGYIRNSVDDIAKFSENTGIPENIIKTIKDHVFYEKHILDDGIKMFPPDLDMAEAWQRLVRGDFVKSDLRLLEHEYAESLILQGEKISWRIGHDITNTQYNWQNYLK